MTEIEQLKAKVRELEAALRPLVEAYNHNAAKFAAEGYGMPIEMPVWTELLRTAAAAMQKEGEG